MLAKVAAIRRILNIIDIFHFIRRDEFVPKTILVDEIHRDISLMGRITRTLGRHCQSVRTQFLMRDQSKIGAVHTAAKCHDTRSDVPQDASKTLLLIKHFNIVTDQ